MKEAHERLGAALKPNQRALSEFDSKQLLSAYSIPVARGAIGRNWNEICKAASSIGYPVVLKFCKDQRWFRVTCSCSSDSKSTASQSNFYEEAALNGLLN